MMLSLPIAGQAENLMQLSPEMRLVRGSSDQGEASYDAVVKKISVDQLPDSVKEDVKAQLLRYTGDINKISDVLVYSWDSPWFHDQKLPPNYLINFAAVQPSPKLLPSLKDPPCNDEGCLVVGYTFSTGKSWQQDFDMRASKVSFVQVPTGGGSNYQMEIRTLSKRDNCNRDGQDTKQGCFRRFSWRKYGLSVVMP